MVIKNIFLLFILMSVSQSFAQVSFDPVRNYTEREKKVLEISVALSNNLLKSECFSEFVNQRKKLIDTNGRNKSQVIDSLKNADLAVPLKMYYKNNGVVGYRQPPNPEVNTNRKFHAGASACSRGSNLTHEWSHSLGYGHSYKANYDRQFSVPYTINAGFLACCECVGVENCTIKKVPKKVAPKKCRRNWKWLWLRTICT